MASNVVFSILVVLIRLLILRRLFQFAQWRFIFGIIFGLTYGPLYLFLHLFKTVRKSEELAEISDGAHVGFASLAMISKFIIDLIASPYERRYITGNLVFMIVYRISIAFLHLVRSEGREVAVKRYAVYGFTLGVLFGPFGFFLRMFSRNAEEECGNTKNLTFRNSIRCAVHLSIEGVFNEGHEYRSSEFRYLANILHQPDVALRIMNLKCKDQPQRIVP